MTTTMTFASEAAVGYRQSNPIASARVDQRRIALMGVVSARFAVTHPRNEAENGQFGKGGRLIDAGRGCGCSVVGDAGRSEHSGARSRCRRCAARASRADACGVPLRRASRQRAHDADDRGATGRAAAVAPAAGEDRAAGIRRCLSEGNQPIAAHFFKACQNRCGPLGLAQNVCAVVMLQPGWLPHTQVLWQTRDRSTRQTVWRCAANFRWVV